MCTDITEWYYCPHRRFPQTRRFCRRPRSVNPHGHQPSINPADIHEASTRFLVASPNSTEANATSDANGNIAEREDDTDSDVEMSDGESYEYPLYSCTRIRREAIAYPTHCERCEGPVYIGSNEKLLLEAGYPLELLSEGRTVGLRRYHCLAPSGHHNSTSDPDPQLYADQPHRSDADVPPPFHILQTRPPIRYKVIIQNRRLPATWLYDVTEYTQQWFNLWDGPLELLKAARDHYSAQPELTRPDLTTAQQIETHIDTIRDSFRINANRKTAAEDLDRRFDDLDRFEDPQPEIQRHLRDLLVDMRSIWHESLEGLNLIDFYGSNLIPTLLLSVGLLSPSHPGYPRFLRNALNEVEGELFVPPTPFRTDEVDAFPAWRVADPVPDVPILPLIRPPPAYGGWEEMGGFFG